MFKKRLTSLQIKYKYIKWSLKRIKSPKLGDKVIYKGQSCSLIQGVNNPYWNLLPLNKENMDKPKRDIYKNIHLDDFELKQSIKRLWFSFKQSYDFQMNYWYKIDVRQGRTNFC